MFLQFPWVLKDYTSETLDLKNPDSYRDFTKPAGAMSANIESELQTRYDINSFNCIVTSKYTPSILIMVMLSISPMS
mgnify:CR=1 FL=1